MSAPPTVRDLIHRLTADIDPNKHVDVSNVDHLVSKCLKLAVAALTSKPATAAIKFQTELLIEFVKGQQFAHDAVRKLQSGDQSPVASYAMAIARLQLESLYSFCFIAQSPENAEIYPKEAWKKNYIRFLLSREDYRDWVRFQTLFSGADFGKTQVAARVTDAERQTIEFQELGTPLPPGVEKAEIGSAPTPKKVIDKITNAQQKKMLLRWYPEYTVLCAFVHGGMQQGLYNAIGDKNSEVHSHITSRQSENFYQRYVLEAPLLYSALACIQTATEASAFRPQHLDLKVTLEESWRYLTKHFLLASPLWDIRGRSVLGILHRDE